MMLVIDGFGGHRWMSCDIMKSPSVINMLALASLLAVTALGQVPTFERIIEVNKRGLEGARRIDVDAPRPTTIAAQIHARTDRSILVHLTGNMVGVCLVSMMFVDEFGVPIGVIPIEVSQSMPFASKYPVPYHPVDRHLDIVTIGCNDSTLSRVPNNASVQVYWYSDIHG